MTTSAPSWLPSNIRRFLTYHLTDNVAELTPFAISALSGGRFPLALGVLQILCLDIGTDLLPALALGAEPVDPTSLRRQPRRDHFVDGALLRRVFAVLVPVEALIEMTAFLVALAAAGWRPGRSFPSGHALLAASGAAFAAVVIGQCANAFACRSTTRWPGRLGWGTNRFLVGAVAVEVVLLAGFWGYRTWPESSTMHRRPWPGGRWRCWRLRPSWPPTPPTNGSGSAAPDLQELPVVPPAVDLRPCSPPGSVPHDRREQRGGRTMAWRWMRHGNPEPDPDAGSEDVGAECEAFLAGRYLEVAVRRDGPIPGWVWLNRLAHSSVAELVELSKPVHDPGNSWLHALAGLAGDILAYCRFADSDVPTLQRHVLVPLELQVMNVDASKVFKPEQLVHLVRDALRQQAAGRS